MLVMRGAHSPRLGVDRQLIADQLSNIVLLQHSMCSRRAWPLARDDVESDDSLAGAGGVVVGLKENGDVSPGPHQQLVRSSRMPLYETAHVVHLQRERNVYAAGCAPEGRTPCRGPRRARCVAGSACSDPPT